MMKIRTAMMDPQEGCGGCQLAALDLDEWVMAIAEDLDPAHSGPVEDAALPLVFKPDLALPMEEVDRRFLADFPVPCMPVAVNA